MLEIFEYQFMVNAMVVGLIIAILASVSGSFMVLRRYSLMTETLAHSALVGVAVGIISHTSPIWMAVLASVLSAWIIEYLRSVYRLYSDAVLSLFLSGSLALAVIIVSLAGAFNSSLFSYLFGSILAVTREDMLLIGGVGFVSLSLLFLFYRELYFIAFDEEVAQVNGIRVAWLNFMLVTIVAVIIALSIRIVGTLLIGALMVIPTIAAQRFRVGFAKTVLLSLVFAISSVLLGIIVSFYLSLPSGATIVMFVLLIFILSLAVNRR